MPNVECESDSRWQYWLGVLLSESGAGMVVAEWELVVS
jgi:hypothetical protein